MAGLMTGAVGGWLGAKPGGPTGPPGPAGLASIAGAEDAARSAGNVEAIVYEYNANFSALPAGNITARLSAIVNRGAVAGLATYRLYVGALAPGNTAGGTVRATCTTVSPTDERQTNLGAAFANPTGEQSVQITVQHGDPAGIAHIDGMTFNIA